MKKKNNTHTTYNIFFGIFFGIFFFIFSSIVVNAEDLIPELTVLSPANDSYHNKQVVEFNGIIQDDDLSSVNLSIKIMNGTELIIEPITVNTVDGSWTVAKQFPEGEHEVTFEVVDMYNNFDTRTIHFFIDTIRPKIKNIKIIPPGVTDVNLFLPAEDMTQIPIDSKILITVEDKSPIDTNNFLFIVTKYGVPEEEPVGLVADTSVFFDGKWEITFSASKPLQYKSTYFVYANPFINDSAGNFLFPKFFKFSTISDFDPEDAHGNHMANTQSCANCHSTHTATGKGLQGGRFGIDVSTSNYCMACHDGTTGAPIIKGFNNHKHQQIGEKTDTCTSCHNPHLTWTAENPNRLKDHFVYYHQDPNVGLIDSDVQLCESCHYKDTVAINYKDHYRILSYKKSITSVGTTEDFTLCFQCHDGNKGKNIMQFYSIPELKDNSGHNIIATDGSPLNGQMPCADCHVTHGTDNIKGLKTKLGHAQRDDAYTTTNTEWTAFDERQFCLKCHNNSTEMYGKKVTLFAKDKNGVDIPEHSPANSTACSSCHGTGDTPEQKSQSAAHAPKKLTTTSQ